MNRKNSIRNVVALACACLALTVCQTYAGDNKAGGHLIVHRIANFGEDLVLTLSVDGAHLADVGDGTTYDGYLPPGRNVLPPMAAPGSGDQQPSPLTLTVEDGKTYSYTARWEGSNVVLSKDP